MLVLDQEISSKKYLGKNQEIVAIYNNNHVSVFFKKNYVVQIGGPPGE